MMYADADGTAAAGGRRPDRKATVFVAVSILILAVVTAFWAPFAVRAFDYDDAYRCSSTPDAACYTQQRDVVLTVGLEGGSRSKNALAYLVLEHFGRINLTSSSGAWSVARAGDTATLQTYRGVLDAIEVRGVTSETPHNPNLSVKHATGFEIAAFALLLCSLFLYAHDRVRWFRPCGEVFALWAFASGFALSFIVAMTSQLVWEVFLGISLACGVLIGVEYFVLRPLRAAAR